MVPKVSAPRPRRSRKTPAERAEPTRGLLDTSVVLADDVLELPEESAISAVTLAELHFGVHVARDEDARKARLRRLTEVEATLEPMPIDAAVSRAYGALAHTVLSAGRRPRARVMDIMIAATAQTLGLPLYTRNHDDFRVFEELMEIRFV